jgi:organic radical activating enzyme
MPFFGLEIFPNNNKNTACCLLPPNSDINSIRSKMLEGQKPSECSKCWNLEQQGVTSDRQIKNRTYDFYADKDIKIVEEECKQGKYSEQIIKIYTSNLCNSTCVTCNPQFSSAWASLKKVQNKKYAIPYDVIENLNYSEFKMLTFVGGEPLYEIKNFSILQKIIDSKNTDCFISFVTNGSAPLSDDKINILQHFKNLNVCLSIDGIESNFEYIRYPLKWNNLQQNLKIFQKLKIDLSVSFTVSNMNIIYYNETIKWFNDHNLKYNHNLVTSPLYFSVNSLPSHIKNNLSHEAKSLLREHTPNDVIRFKEFVKEITSQDKLKKISIKDYMPELYKIITEND